MTASPAPEDKLGTPVKARLGQWVQTDRKAHEAWGDLIARKPRAATLLHYLVANMGHQNALIVSQKTLAKLIGIHERTVRRAVSDLVEENWIQIVRIGSGKEAAYVVNDRVAWGQPRDQLNLSVFSATVLADREDQDPQSTKAVKLKRIPIIYRTEHPRTGNVDEDQKSSFDED